jgi:hypothetical protein
MSNLHVSGLWAPGRTNYSSLADQSVDFARRLRAVHPLFSEISPTGERSGYHEMLKQPLVRDIGPDGWEEIFRASQATYGFVDVSYWNRRSADGESCFYTIHANDDVLSNGIVVNKVPQPLNNPDNLKATLKAQIEVFGVELGEVFTLWPGHVEDPIVLSWHWLLWLREGQPWPGGPESRFKDTQGPHTIAEPWLGGTLYTWPEYEPWGLSSRS